MSMRKRKKVQILSREELMLRRWDFRLVPSERSLEAVGKSVDLHIIGRSKAFDLFPRTHKGKNRCILREKHALINSRERTRIWLHTRHQDEAIEPCGDGSCTTSDRYVKILDLREGNEESSEETTGCKASVYEEFDDCPRVEKYV